MMRVLIVESLNISYNWTLLGIDFLLFLNLLCICCGGTTICSVLRLTRITICSVQQGLPVFTVEQFYLNCCCSCEMM